MKPKWDFKTILRAERELDQEPKVISSLRSKFSFQLLSNQKLQLSIQFSFLIKVNMYDLKTMQNGKLLLATKFKRNLSNGSF